MNEAIDVTTDIVKSARTVQRFNQDEEPGNQRKYAPRNTLYDFRKGAAFGLRHQQYRDGGRNAGRQAKVESEGRGSNQNCARSNDAPCGESAFSGQLCGLAAILDLALKFLM